MENQNQGTPQEQTQQFIDPLQILGYGKVEMPTKEASPPAAEAKTEVIETPLMKVELKPDDIFKKLSAETGFTFEKEEDVINTFKKLKDFETREKEYAEKSIDGQNYKSFFNTLPEDIKRIVVAYGSGENYQDVIKQQYGLGGVDLSKPWGEHEDKSPLIERYTETSKDDFDELDEKQQKVIERAAKSAYEKDRNNFVEGNARKKQELEARLNTYADSLRQSVDKTIAKLKTDFPDMPESKVNEVRNLLYGKPLQEIYDDTGVYKEDAATKIALANYGQETIAQIMNKMDAKARTEVEEARKTATQGKLEEHIRAANDKVPASEVKDDKSKLNEALDGFSKVFTDTSSAFKNKNVD